LPRGNSIDSGIARAYINVSECGGSAYMPGTTHRNNADLEEKRVMLLEFLAASAILSIVALVLYMIFSYRPA
jgi:hypothetical protein